MSTAAKLTVQGVGKTFTGNDGIAVAALEGVDLTVERGEFVSIVGPSGCGKSTLLDIIAGLIRPSTGRVLIDGVSQDRLLGASAYMPQKDLLMPWRSVLDNTILGLEVAGVPRRQARRQACTALERFGLAGFERAWPGQLSGGMRQRAALLRTFLCGKDLLLLDEPFGALDALTRRQMQRWLLEVWAADRTILFVTHDVEEAIFLSDRIYLMSPRPGHMRDCVAVDLPRPRAIEVTLSVRFLELKRLLLGPLLDQSIRSSAAAPGRSLDADAGPHAAPGNAGG